jgi:GR25 family glycosyltransferase involved in LPS biosynthesis
MDKIDIVYYINLDYRVDRKQEFLEWIDKSGFPETHVERVSAIHTPGRGHIGCLLSHIRAIETFLKSDKDLCLVFEDDYMPLDSASYWENFEKLFASRKKFDIVMLSYNVLQSEKTDVYFLQKVSQSYTSSGYLVTRTFAPKLLANFKDALQNCLREESITGVKSNEFCLDVHWSKLMVESEWFCFYPRIGTQRPSFSDVQGHYTTYNG